MNFMLMDNSGNGLDAFSDEAQAIEAFVRLLKEDRSAALDVALLAFDDRGVAVGEPMVGADLLPETAVEVQLKDSGFRQIGGLTFSWTTISTLQRLLAPDVVGATGEGLALAS